MPIAWDDAKERQFLLTIIHVTSPGAPNWNKVAELLNAQAGGGSDYVGNALRQKFAKMKKGAEELYGSMPAVDDDASAAPKTPGKRSTAKKANGETPAKSTGKRKSKKESSEEPKDDEEDVSATPSKKVKTEVVAGEDEDLIS